MAAILVVDDDADIVRLLRVALGLAGHEVVTTQEFAKIVPLAAAAGVQAAVLDMALPGYSGLDVLAALRAHPKLANLPVMFLSSRRTPQERVRGLQAGADDYVTKPFEAPEVVLRVERLLRARQTSVGTTAEDEAQRLEHALEVLEERRRSQQPLGEVFVGRYLVMDVIGEGGMGTVYRGWDPKLQRPVALKTIRASGDHLPADRSEMVHRLLLEAIMVAQVSHPNIVAVHDVGDAREVGFIAMEFVDGTTLHRYLSRLRRLPPSQAVPLAAGIFRGLGAAHQNRLVHHDVKPGNVLLGRNGSIKVTDFGVAELMSSWARDARMVFGTPGYLPPETLRGRGYDARGDIFAGGVILWQCLTGERPFTGATVEDVARATVERVLPALHGLDPRVPPELDQLLQGLLAKRRDERVADALEAAERLEHLALRHGWRWSCDLAAIGGDDGQDSSGRARSRLIPALGEATDKP